MSEVGELLYQSLMRFQGYSMPPDYGVTHLDVLAMVERGLREGRIENVTIGLSQYGGLFVGWERVRAAQGVGG